MVKLVPSRTLSVADTGWESKIDDRNIPFLPNEVHAVIGQHVDRDDLFDYRLASKALAEVGKSKAFSTIVLRNTAASVTGFKAIVHDKQLCQLVRTWIWDLNGWRIGPDVRDWHEWTRHCESRAKQVSPEQAALYMELAVSCAHWEAYLSRLEEEMVAIQDIHALLTSSEGRFISSYLPNLSTIHIVKGVYQLKNWRLYQPHKQFLQPLQPVTRPLSTWRGS